MTVNHLEVIEIQQRARQGFTEPFFCEASDGLTYVVKGKMATTAGLIKEWLGANLGKAFGLEIPDFNIIHVDRLVLETHDDGAMNSLGPGPAFASRCISPVYELNMSMIPDISLKVQQDILIFDAWVRNSDRTLSELGGNPNLLWDGEKAHVIDHNLIFEPELSAIDLRESHVFRGQLNNIFEDYLLRDEFQTRMQSALTGWSGWWDTLPEEWIELNDELQSLSQEQIYQQLEQDAQGDIWKRLST